MSVEETAPTKFSQAEARSFYETLRVINDDLEVGRLVKREDVFATELQRDRLQADNDRIRTAVRTLAEDSLTLSLMMHSPGSARTEGYKDFRDFRNRIRELHYALVAVLAESRIPDDAEGVETAEEVAHGN